MRIAPGIHHLSHRLGVDVVRYPLHDPLARTVKLLDHHGITCVVDIGANDGGFATAIRDLGYAGRIISFEPLSGPFKALQRRSRSDRLWEAHRLAAGDTTQQVTVNIAGNSALSSSVLPMLDTHVAAAPASRYVGSEVVSQRRLDMVLPALGVDPGGRTFLKVDVQGYEERVLDGAASLFDDGVIGGVQLELSLVPLYAGAMSYRQGLDRAERLGMTLMGLDPVFADPQTGRLLQADAVFFAE